MKVHFFLISRFLQRKRKWHSLLNKNNNYSHLKCPNLMNLSQASQICQTPVSIDRRLKYWKLNATNHILAGVICRWFVCFIMVSWKQQNLKLWIFIKKNSWISTSFIGCVTLWIPHVTLWMEDYLKLHLQSL